MPRRPREFVQRPYQRQRPVSCNFCRSRKLRCSRDAPCTNCSARGLECDLFVPRQTTSGLYRRSSESGHTPEGELELSGVLDRLRRLEQVVLKDSSAATPFRQPQARGSPTGKPPLLRLSTERATESVCCTKKLPQPATDAEFLERECVVQSNTALFVSESMVFRACPIRNITKPHSLIVLTPSGPSNSTWDDAVKCIWLPSRLDTEALMERYLDHQTHLHHVVHIPSVLEMVDEIYRDLEGPESNPKPEQIAMLLAMISSSVHSQLELSANEQAIVFTASTMSALTQCKLTSSGSLEEIQAMIILSFVVSHLEGMSRRYWSLFSDAIVMARSLGLHRIDHDRNGAMNGIPAPDTVKAEVGRRLWWYLVATDWMFSRYPGPFEGTYTIQPQHMSVRPPLNADDEDLFDGMDLDVIGKPLSQPTIMSYNLQRIRLARTCFELIDHHPWDARSSLTHQQIMDIDAKIDGFVQTVPEFFQLESSSYPSSSDMTTTDHNGHGLDRHSVGITMQRYLMLSLVHAQRCKLHLHYLSRACSAETSPDSKEYSTSRDICLRTARLIIRSERALTQSDIPFARTRLKFSGFLYCIFMAVMVLGLDLCLSKQLASTAPHGGQSRGQHSATVPTIDEEERKTELIDACAVLEEARSQSTVAAKLLDSLMAILRKHKLGIPLLEQSRLRSGVQRVQMETASRSASPPFNAGQATTGAESDGPTSSTAYSHEDGGSKTSGYDVDDDDDAGVAMQDLSYFDELWHTFNDGMDYDTLLQSGWFSGLEPQF